MSRRAVFGRLSGRVGSRRPARWVVALAVAAAALGAAPAAHADEQPSILKAYGLDWIERVREEAWPQPVAERPVICLLDTGVAVTADTPADDPAGPIVARLAIDGGTGLPQGDAFEHLHGTQMASVIAAPRNGFGTVGVFPQARIVSVRVTEGDAIFITPAGIRRGVLACSDWAGAQHQRLAVVSMAESNYDQRPSDVEQWVFAARRAADDGAVFVAAVGNEADAASVAPVAAEGLVAVAAGGDTGELCSFAKYGESTALLGPGCSEELVGQTTSWPAGSSAATSAVSGLLAALAARQPGSTPAERIALLQSEAVRTAGARRLVDGTGVANASFGGLIQPAVSPLMPTDSGAVSISSGSGARGEAARSSGRVRLWRPGVVARRHDGYMTVRLRDRKSRGRLMVRLRGGRVVGGGRRTLRTKLPKGNAFVEVWVESFKGTGWRSLSCRVKVTG